MTQNRQGNVSIFMTDSRKVIEKTGRRSRSGTARSQWDAKITLTDIYQWIKENESTVKSIFVG